MVIKEKKARKKGNHHKPVSKRKLEKKENKQNINKNKELVTKTAGKARNGGGVKPGEGEGVRHNSSTLRQ